MFSKCHMIKTLENCFRNMSCFFWIKLIPVLKKLIQKFPITRTPLPPSSSLSNFTSCLANCLQISLANWNSLQHNPYNVLHWFPYFFLSHSATCHHKYLIYQNICNAQPSKFIIKLYTDHNALWVKRATYQKAESLRAASLSS